VYGHYLFVLTKLEKLVLIKAILRTLKFYIGGEKMKELPKFLERKAVLAKLCIKKHDIETLKEIIIKYPDLLNYPKVSIFKKNENEKHLIVKCCKHGFNEGIDFFFGKMNPIQIKILRQEMLEKAIIWEHPETLKFLIKKVGLKKENFPDLIKACFQKSPSGQFVCRKKMLEILFENGVDVHTGNDLCLKLACRRGCVDVVRWLVEEKRANVNAKRGKHELEPILEALRTFHDIYRIDTEATSEEAVQIIKTLLRYGAVPIFYYQLGWPRRDWDPLKDMTKHGDVEVVRMLLNFFRPNKWEEDIEVILENAARNSLEMFSFLTEFLMQTIPTVNIIQLALKFA